MKAVLLDTDIIINFLRGKEKAREFIMALIDEFSLYCSVITVAEIHAGLRAHEREKTDDFLDSLNIVEVNARIARKAGQYKREGKSRKLELDDCIIAASASDLGARLVTGNGKHYPMEDIDKTIMFTG